MHRCLVKLLEISVILSSNLVGFWSQSLVFHQKAFIALLIISLMRIVKPQSTNSSSWLIGFQPRATSKVTFLKYFPLQKVCFSYQLSLHLRTPHQINTRNTHAVECLLLYSLIQSTWPAVLTGEHYIGFGTNIWSFKDLNSRLSIYHCFDHHSECTSLLINLYK